MTLDDRTVEGYLAVVEQQLPGPSSLHNDVLDEVRDGLLATAEDTEGADGHGRARAVLDAFGDPVAIGAALADELRLRLARRRALQIFAVLVVLHVGWQVYRSTVGFPASLVPDAAAGALFLGAVDTLRAVGWVALTGALVAACATSLRIPDRLRIGVVMVTIGATTLTAVCASVALLVVGRGTPTALAAGLLSAALLAAMVAVSCQVLRYLLARSVV